MKVFLLEDGLHGFQGETEEGISRPQQNTNGRTIEKTTAINCR